MINKDLKSASLVSSSKLSPKSIGEKIKDIIWPVHKHELSRFLSITALMFCILFIQNIIRALKDSVVNTLIGAEVISFLKFWGVLPCAFLSTIIYVKLINTFKGNNVFYIILFSFLSFFGIFGFVIFPNYNALHLSVLKTEKLILLYPHLKWFILIFAKWSFSLFYIIAELWPNIVFALLFWQFVNQITPVEQSKRFYSLFGLLGQTGLYISGQFLINLPNFSQYIINTFNTNNNITTTSVQIIIATSLILGILAVYFFWFLNNKILVQDKEIKFTIKTKALSIKESFKLIMQSTYIRLIATLLICYGIAINLAETPWKSFAAKEFNAPEKYAAFAGQYLSYNGICTVLLVIVSSNIIRRLGWKVAALITPGIVIITGMLFFTASNFKVVTLWIANILVITDPVMIVIVVGAIQNILSKSTKYTLFDSTKEMSYVPLNDELKAKGKAAADIIGTKLGKSIGALLQSAIFIIIPAATYQSITIYLMGVFIVVCIIWIHAVYKLSAQYNKMTKT